MAVGDLTAALQRAAERRRAQNEDAEQLAAEIKLLVRQARSSGLAMSEIARLLGIDRSTLYRVYAA